MGLDFTVKYWSKVLALIKLFSFLLILLSTLLNVYTLSLLIGKNEPFSNQTTMVIYELQIFLLIIGVLLFICQRFYLQNCSKQVKELIVNMLIFLFSLFILLLFLEILIRVFDPQKTLNELKSMSPQIFEEGKYISWVFKPNSTGVMSAGEFNVKYRINSLGMRDVERNLTRTRGIKRMLVLGDSFTEGFGVEQNETYSYLLEKLINNETDQIEIWNAGISGYSSDTEYLYLKNNIDIIKSDIVLIGFYAGNDILDLKKNSWTVLDNDGLPEKIISKIVYVENNQLRLTNNENNPYRLDFKGYVNLFFFRWSHLYIFIKKMSTGAGLKNEEIIPALSETSDISILYEKNMKLLDAIKTLVESRNMSLKIVIIPSRMQVDEREWQFAKEKFKNFQIKRDFVQEKILKWCDSRKITCIDLLPKFLENKEQLYHTLSDAHFNSLGHLRTAQVILKELFNSTEKS